MLTEVCVAASSWTALYFIIQFRLQREPMWSCRLVTLVHACVVATLALYSGLVAGPSALTDPGGPLSFLEALVLEICLGYFMFDMTWCLYYKTEGATMMAHHVVSLYSISRTLFKGYSGTEAVAGIGGLECTNPFLQLRWFLRDAGLGQTIWYKVTEVIFTCMFFVMRCLYSGLIVFRIWMHPKPDWETKICALSFYIISWIFMIMIAKYIVAKYIRIFKGYIKVVLHEHDKKIED